MRLATLAANSHNTQPWRFHISDRGIDIRPDLSRRCPVVDPDDHHLFATLGCAAENIVQAAPLLGFSPSIRFDDHGDGQVHIALERTAPRSAPLAHAINKRQCTRALYDGRTVSPGSLELLQTAGTLDDVTCQLITDKKGLEAVLGHVVDGNTAQMRDPAFMDELKAWIRFNDAQALVTLDGLNARASADPRLPPWLARRLLPFVMTQKGEADKITKHMRSSAGIAVFAAAKNDKAHWVQAGRAYQRFALQATALDLRHAFINQPTEVLALRPKVATLIGLGDRRPDLIVRFGFGPLMPRSLRRPVENVIDLA